MPVWKKEYFVDGEVWVDGEWDDSGGQGARMKTALLFLALAGTMMAQEAPVFKVDVQLVRLLVNVKDTAGNLVGSLEAKDFTVSDNGVKQEIAVFERQPRSLCRSRCCSTPAVPLPRI